MLTFSTGTADIAAGIGRRHFGTKEEHVKLKINYQHTDHLTGQTTYQTGYVGNDMQKFSITCETQDFKKLVVRFNLFEELINQLNTAIDNCESQTDRTYLKRLRKRAEVGL